jgi:hypothetical protein
MLTVLRKFVATLPARQKSDITVETYNLSSLAPGHHVPEPEARTSTSPIEVMLLVAFVTTALRAVLPNSAILASQLHLIRFFQTTTHAALNAARSVDPAGRPALGLMALFCVWFVGVMVLWRDEDQKAPLTATEEEVLTLCQELAAAEVLHDERTIESILHDQFVFMDSDGKTSGKTEFVLLTRLMHAKSQELSAERPLIVGSRAFVEGTRTFLPQSIRDEPLTYHFSICFDRINGKWRAIEQRVKRPARHSVLSAEIQQVAA